MRGASGARCQVCFLPSGCQGEVDRGITLRDAAHQLGCAIESICGGLATCGKCRVRILEGRFEQPGIESSRDHASDATVSEQRVLRRCAAGEDERLSCQARVAGDLVVYVPEACRVGRPIVLKGGRGKSVELDPALHRYYVDLAAASLDFPEAGWERVQGELARHFDLQGLLIDLPALQALPGALLAGGGKLSLTLWQQRQVIRVEAGYVEALYGMAVDLGTTTLAAYLCDLNSGEILASCGAINPQIPFGEDIMHRIASSRGADQLGHMQGLLADAITGLARDAALQASIPVEAIAELVVVGNTVMHHLLLGLDVQCLGIAPFAPVVRGALDVKARDLGIGLLPWATVHLLPVEAGFVGSDNVAVMIAEAPYEGDELVLIMDIGTNGELMLGNRERMLCASCPTGPALEGANIRFGMRAAPGAIDRVRVDPDSLEVRFTVIGDKRWSHRRSPEQIGALGLCGSAGIDVVAELFRAGVVDGGGRMHLRGHCDRLRAGEDGSPEFVIARADQTAIGRDICFTQADVRAIQLAKGALYGGSRVLLQAFGVERPDRVVLAGAFGSTIDLERALRIGLFPDGGLANVSAVGNAAGDGARMALLNCRKRREAGIMARKVEYRELSVEAAFNDAFVEATQIPHAVDRFPSLENSGASGQTGEI